MIGDSRSSLTVVRDGISAGGMSLPLWAHGEPLRKIDQLTAIVKVDVADVFAASLPVPVTVKV
jgi:hypothetical protein